jgi:hypothetical protein
MARDDPEVQSFTKADEENLVTELTEYRALKKTGVRASNKAASRDILLTLDRVIDEVSCRHKRSYLIANIKHIVSSTAWLIGLDSVHLYWVLATVSTTRPRLHSMDLVTLRSSSLRFSREIPGNSRVSSNSGFASERKVYS